MRISACFPILLNLSSGKSKKTYLDILKTSCKSFSMKFLEVNNFLRNYLQYFAKKVEQNLKVFLWTKEKNSVQSLKQNLTQFTPLKYTTLLSLQQQSQDLSLLLLQGLDCLTLLSLDLLTLYNELFMLPFPSFPFIVLFLQIFWSKFAILFKLFSTKTNHFSTKSLILFLSPVSLSSLASYVFMSLQNLSINFFSYFLSFLFVHFRYQTVFFEYLLRFYVHFLQISLLGLQEVATFDFSSCFWLVPFHEGSKMISKTSRRYCKFFAVV